MTVSVNYVSPQSGVRLYMRKSIDTRFSAESEGCSISLFLRKDFDKNTAELRTCYNIITKLISVTCNNSTANYVIL